jgi:2-dehydropantoate 2-reductase
MRIAIVGVGAIGSVVAGALLHSARPEVILCARRPFSRIRITAGDGVFEYAASPKLDPREVPRCDWTLLCTKAHQIESPSEWIRATYGLGSKIAVLQNGVDHAERVLAYADSVSIVPVIVWLPVRPISPGEVLQQGPARLIVASDDAGQEFRSLFDGTRIDISLTDDFVTEAWSKLVSNAVNGAICALTAQPMSVFRRPQIAQLARDIIKEVVAVGRAEGAKLDDSIADQIVSRFATIPDAENHGNSMYYDRMAGRPMELEARNGVIVRLGAKHGIPTPVCSALYALLTAIDGRAPQ